MNSGYSGMMTEQEALWRPLCEFAKQRFSNESFVMDRLAFAHVCDVGPVPQFLALEHSKDWHGDKLCVHKDVRDYLLPAGRAHLDSLYAKAAATGQPMEEAYSQGLDWITYNIDSIFDVDMVVDCLAHHKKCRVDTCDPIPGAESSRPLSMFFAGVTCNAWGRQGKHEGVAHPSEAAHNAMLGRRVFLARKSKKTYSA